MKDGYCDGRDSRNERGCRDDRDKRDGREILYRYDDTLFRCSLCSLCVSVVYVSLKRTSSAHNPISWEKKSDATPISTTTQFLARRGQICSIRRNYFLAEVARCGASQKRSPWDSTISTAQGDSFWDVPQIAAYHKKFKKLLCATAN